jgi:hypothetical protein
MPVRHNFDWIKNRDWLETYMRELLNSLPLQVLFKCHFFRLSVSDFFFLATPAIELADRLNQHMNKY